MRIRKFSLIFITLMALASGRPVTADPLQDTVRLARAGASQLALAQIEQLQPEYQQQPVEWLRWEDQRLYILQTREDWQGIIQRAEALPAKTPASFRNKALTLAADAQLALGDAVAARALYRQLLWQDETREPHERLQRRWREGIIQSYLGEALLEDAEIAIRRYRLDYPEQDQQSLVWMAEVLVQQRRYAETVALEEQAAENPAIAPLIELARLRQQAERAATLAKRAQALLTANEAASYEQWVIFAEAAAMQQDFRLQIGCLEQAIMNKPYRVSPAFQISGGQLWAAYLNYGQQYGNQQQLLMGDDEAWYFAATEALEQDPVLARALFAVLAVHSLDAGRQRLGHDYLVRLLQKLNPQGELLQQLYQNNPRFPTLKSIPLPARYQLVDHALAAGRIVLASELMQDLDIPPAEDAWSWQLRRARVMIMGDAGEQGVAILRELTAEPIEEAAAIDALMQVLFDLQKTDRHPAALEIFWRLQAMPLDSQRRRELFFWMAESFSALDQHDSAARAYLESAILENERAMDPWAQTARYHAAKSLAAAGYREDARTLLEQLLRATKDKDRRAVLRQELIQLNGHE